MLRKATVLFFLSLIAMQSIAWGQQQTQFLQHLWEVDPPLGDIWATQRSARAIRFEVERLKSTYAEDRLETAQQLCLEHANPNFKQRERAIQLLLERLKAGEENQRVKRAMFSAALCLGEAKHAETLWSLSKSDSAIAATVERKLVQWKSPTAIQTWRQRLSDPSSKPTELATALEGIAVAGNASDGPALQSVIFASHSSSANKFLAAVALGNLVKAGLEDLALQLVGSDLEQRDVLAAHLLKRHTSDKAQSQLRKILSEGSTTARAVAYRAISETMPPIALELAKEMTTQPHAELRSLALDVLHASKAEPSLRIQGTLLNDPHPEIRSRAAKNLIEMGTQGSRAIVDELVLANLKAGEWAGMEKAIEIAVELQDRRYCKGFVKLLDHPRSEVSMRAAWALMELGIESETLAGMLTHAEKLVAELQSKDYRFSEKTATDQIRLSYLNEAFGKNRYTAATEMLMKFIPKRGHQFGIVSRASAIWSLGKLNTGKDNPALRAKLYERMSDFEPSSPEDFLVRFSCNLALGEMANPESRDTIEQYGEQPPSPIAFAAAWALSQIEKASTTKPLN